MLCRLTHWTVSKADLINNVEPVIKVDGASLNWGCGHLIAPYYSFIYSGRTVNRNKWSPVSCGRRTTFYHCVTISNQCDWIIFVQKFKELKAEMKWELIIVSLKSSAVTERSLKITQGHSNLHCWVDGWNALFKRNSPDCLCLFGILLWYIFMLIIQCMLLSWQFDRRRPWGHTSWRTNARRCPAGGNETFRRQETAAFKKSVCRQNYTMGQCLNKTAGRQIYK